MDIVCDPKKGAESYVSVYTHASPCSRYRKNLHFEQLKLATIRPLFERNMVPLKTRVRTQVIAERWNVVLTRRVEPKVSVQGYINSKASFRPVCSTNRVII